MPGPRNQPTIPIASRADSAWGGAQLKKDMLDQPHDVVNFFEYVPEYKKGKNGQLIREDFFRGKTPLLPTAEQAQLMLNPDDTLIELDLLKDGRVSYADADPNYKYLFKDGALTLIDTHIFDRGFKGALGISKVYDSKKDFNFRFSLLKYAGVRKVTVDYPLLHEITEKKLMDILNAAKLHGIEVEWIGNVKKYLEGNEQYRYMGQGHDGEPKYQTTYLSAGDQSARYELYGKTMIEETQKARGKKEDDLRKDLHKQLYQQQKKNYEEDKKYLRGTDKLDADKKLALEQSLGVKRLDPADSTKTIADPMVIVDPKAILDNAKEALAVIEQRMKDVKDIVDSLEKQKKNLNDHLNSNIFERTIFAEEIVFGKVQDRHTPPTRIEQWQAGVVKIAGTIYVEPLLPGAPGELKASWLDDNHQLQEVPITNREHCTEIINLLNAHQELAIPTLAVPSPPPKFVINSALASDVDDFRLATFLCGYDAKYPSFNRSLVFDALEKEQEDLKTRLEITKKACTDKKPEFDKDPENKKTYEELDKQLENLKGSLSSLDKKRNDLRKAFASMTEDKIRDKRQEIAIQNVVPGATP